MSTSDSVVIPIVGQESSCTKEWTILELNGELIMPVDLPTENDPHSAVLGPDQVELGSLHYHDKKTMKMILGSHELKGTIEVLKQPFCIFEKERNGAAVANGEEESSNVQYKVAGVITKKVLFNNYPKTIMK